MKTVIGMSPNHYNRFLNRCDEACREYAILKNGVVLHQAREGQDERIIEIPCEMEEAHMLLQLAIWLFPEAAPEIEKSLILSRRQL